MPKDCNSIGLISYRYLCITSSYPWCSPDPLKLVLQTIDCWALCHIRSKYAKLQRTVGYIQVQLLNHTSHWGGSHLWFHKNYCPYFLPDLGLSTLFNFITSASNLKFHHSLMHLKWQGVYKWKSLISYTSISNFN